MLPVVRASGAVSGPDADSPLHSRSSGAPTAPALSTGAGRRPADTGSWPGTVGPGQTGTKEEPVQEDAVVQVCCADPALARAVQVVAAACGLAGRPVVDLPAAPGGWPSGTCAVVSDNPVRLAAALADVGRSLPAVLVLAEPRSPAAEGVFRPTAPAPAGVPVVHLPGQEAQLAALLMAALPRPRHRSAVGVLGARGGLGASTLAAGLALASAQAGGSCLLADLDPWSGGLDLLLGADQLPGPRWSALARLDGPAPPGALRSLLPCSAGVSVLAQDRSTHELAQAPAPSVAAALDRAVGDFDAVVIDLPRTAPHLWPALARRCQAVVLLVADSSTGVLAARVMIESLALDLDSTGSPATSPERPGRGGPGSDVEGARLGQGPGGLPPLLLTVRCTGGGLPAGEVAELLGLPVQAVLADSPRLRRWSESGDLPAVWRSVGGRRHGFGRTCRTLLAAAADRRPR